MGRGIENNVSKITMRNAARLERALTRAGVLIGSIPRSGADMEIWKSVYSRIVRHAIELGWFDFNYDYKYDKEKIK